MNRGWRVARRLNREVTGYDIKILNNMEQLYEHIQKGDGVVATPLAKYRWHNIRVCRPFKIDPADLDRVIDSVIANLGKAYDNRNFLELTLLLLCPVKVGPLKNWTIQTCLGNCAEHQVICSGMIAQAFQRVRLLGIQQGRVSNHLACLKWCGYVTTTSKGCYTVYCIADKRVRQILQLSRKTVAKNAEHLWACTRISATKGTSGVIAE